MTKKKTISNKYGIKTKVAKKLSPYQAFVKENYTKFKNSCKTDKAGDILIKIAQAWKDYKDKR